MINELEKYFLVVVFFVYMVISVLFANDQKDINFIPYTALVYLVCVFLCYIVSVVLNNIPFLPREVATFGFSVFLLLFLGIPPVLSFMVVATVLVVFLFWKCKSYGVLNKRRGRGLLAVIAMLSMSYIYFYLFENNVSPLMIKNIPNNTNLRDGSYKIEKLSYGSGADFYRDEYAAAADWVSPTYDAGGALKAWSGFSGWYRTKFWGFNPSALPLNARVWLPKGAGPFPVVFILHGDHSMQDFSDGGYGYIAQSLAANGFISVSVDNNFLNRSWSDLLMTSTLQGPAEIEVRAKLLVEHFKFWSKWNADPDSPLYQKVDLNNIALVGHSRGGETVSVVPHILTNQNITDVRVKSIISIAPTDGNFWPDGQANHLNDVNYLLMQGSMDGEVPFNGRGQYSRADVYTQDDAIKLALYIEGANHGQFNTSWGMNDKEFVSPVASRWNLSGIMPAVAQRGIAKDVIESFLNYSIKGRDDEKAYLIKSGLKNKWRSISEIKTQYDFGGIAPLIDFESDTQEDLTAEEGVTSSIESLGLSVHAQLIHWQGCAVGEECSVSYDLTRFDKVQGRQLRFDIANMMDNNLGLTVEISYFGGSLKTSNVVLPPKISRYLTKLDTHLKRKSSEVVFETISLNLDADLYVESVKFILNESPSRAFFVDNIVVL